MLAVGLSSLLTLPSQLNLGLNAEVVHDERLDVGILVNHLAQWLAVAVTGVDIDADELHGIAGVACLQLCGILERVGRHHGRRGRW